MSAINNGGTAYPMQDPQAIHAYSMAACAKITEPDERDRAYMQARAEAIGGLSVRDYFAAKIAEGDAAANKGWGACVSDEQIAARVRTYYRIADAMLAEREKGGAA